MTSEKNRDYSFAAKNHQNKKCVQAIDVVTGMKSFYNSLYSAQQHLSINAGLIKMISECKNGCKIGKSEKDGNIYKFEYIENSQMPENYKKASDVRPIKFTEEEKRIRKIESLKKWQKKNLNVKHVVISIKIVINMCIKKSVKKETQFLFSDILQVLNWNPTVEVIIISLPLD